MARQKYDISHLPLTTMETPHIIEQNIVVTCCLWEPLQNAKKTKKRRRKGRKDHRVLDLQFIAQKILFGEYNPDKFAALTMRLHNPRTTALLFSSGNMVCTGSKSILQALLACRKYTRILQNTGLKVSFYDFCVQNVVASVEVQFPIRLVELAEDHGPFLSYEPDLFPGAVLRVQNPAIVLLIFRSGKIVITGARDVEQIRRAFKAVYEPFILAYRDTEDSNRSSSMYRLKSHQTSFAH